MSKYNAPLTVDQYYSARFANLLKRLLEQYRITKPTSVSLLGAVPPRLVKTTHFNADAEPLVNKPVLAGKTDACSDLLMFLPISNLLATYKSPEEFPEREFFPMYVCDTDRTPRYFANKSQFITAWENREISLSAVVIPIQDEYLDYTSLGSATFFNTSRKSNEFTANGPDKDFLNELDFTDVRRLLNVLSNDNDVSIAQVYFLYDPDKGDVTPIDISGDVPPEYLIQFLSKLGIAQRIK